MAGVATCCLEWEKTAATHAHHSSQHDGSESYFEKNASIILSKSISRMPWPKVLNFTVQGISEQSVKSNSALVMI